MNIREIQEQIMELKEEKDFAILAHSYQDQEILEVADVKGDSFYLSQKAKELKNENLLVCGVRFMAETCKILNPEKRVYISNLNAGCPMADQLSREDVLKAKEEYPGLSIVAYINTSADLKRECDLIVTSSSAVKLINKLDEDELVFLPDPYLGSWLQEKIKDKKFHFLGEGCPIHKKLSVDDIEMARKEHPEAKILIHPEAGEELSELADYTGSTSGILSYAKNSSEREFVIGTENNIVKQLKYSCQEKKFYPLSKLCICPNMRLSNLNDILSIIKGESEGEIELDQRTIDEASKPINRMIEWAK